MNIFFEMKDQDKILHFVAGFLIGLFSMIFTEKTIISMFFVCSVAYVKEALDSRSVNHVPDGLDFIATVVGGLVATIIFLKV